MLIGRQKWTLIIQISFAVLAGGCPPRVEIPTEDKTPPVVKMDVFGVPLPPGAGSGEEIIGMEAGTDTIRRTVPLDKNITAVGSAEDTGGIKRVTMVLDVFTTCVRSSSHSFEHHTVKLGEAVDADPTSGSTSRFVQGAVRLRDYWTGSCGAALWTTERIDAYIFVTAENLRSGTISTSKVLLQYPEPR